ncbi:MAG: VTT domain-containing protein [Opitutaceae bacterium]
MKPLVSGILRLTLFVFVVSVIVSLPFIFFGESFVMPLMEGLRHKTVWLVLLAIALLGADAVLPVPSAWVIIFLAQQTGVAAGIVGGTIGLAIGVVVSAWVGKAAVGRAAPKFFPEAELVRLRESIQKHTTITLACMRSVPVLAETSVMIAGAAGVSTSRIFWATALPNVVISVIYAVAADDSFLTASLAFLGTIAISYLSWKLYDRLLDKSSAGAAK